MNIPSHFFVFDCESLGLHGQTFSVAGLIIDSEGTEVQNFAYHTPSSGIIGDAEDRKWVEQNVTHHSDSVELPCEFFVMEEFWKQWERAKAAYPGIAMAGECIWPVEAKFLEQCVEQDKAKRNWEGPYPLHEIASFRLAAGINPLDPCERKDNELPAHEPLADSRQSARLLMEAIEILRNRA